MDFAFGIEDQNRVRTSSNEGYAELVFISVVADSHLSFSSIYLSMSRDNILSVSKKKKKTLLPIQTQHPQHP